MEGFLKNEVHLSRGNIYLFLKNCLSDIPSVAFYEMIENMLHQLENIVQGSDNIDMQEGYQGMLDFITERNKLSSNELDELDLYISREYTSCLSSATCGLAKGHAVTQLNAPWHVFLST